MSSRICGLLLLLVFCSSVFGFSTRVEHWSEDAVLHDGRVINVERWVGWTFQFVSGDEASMSLFASWPDKFWLKFKHPRTKEIIKWQGEQYYRPVLLDVVNDVPYLVVYGRPTEETKGIYGCPELPYIYLQYDQKKFEGWGAVTEQEAPSILRQANLSPEYPDIYGKDHLSAADVQYVIKRLEYPSSYHFQGMIPRTYKEWHYAYKNSYLNERQGGDCRPPRKQLGSLALPAATQGFPEVLETINYMPQRVPTDNEWRNLAFDQRREQSCKNLFRATDPDDRMQDQRFIGDSTGNKRVPYSINGQFQMGVRILCDEYVWFVAHQEERGKLIITKYKITGDLVYRLKFPQPDPMPGLVGYIAIPSLRSDAGYLYFDWMYFRDIERKRHIQRTLKVRIREPGDGADTGSRK